MFNIWLLMFVEWLLSPNLHTEYYHVCLCYICDRLLVVSWCKIVSVCVGRLLLQRTLNRKKQVHCIFVPISISFLPSFHTDTLSYTNQWSLRVYHLSNTLTASFIISNSALLGTNGSFISCWWRCGTHWLVFDDVFFPASCHVAQSHMSSNDEIFIIYSV